MNFPVLYQSLERDFFPKLTQEIRKRLLHWQAIQVVSTSHDEQSLLCDWLGLFHWYSFLKLSTTKLSAQIENDGIVSSFVIGCQRNTGLWLAEKSMPWALIDRDIIGRNKMGHNWAWKLLHFVQLLIGSFVVKTLLWPLLN